MRQLTAPFDTYDELVGAIRHRLAELQVTCEAASALAGLTETHVSKLVNPARSKMLGRISFTVLLQVLGLRLIAVTDEEAYAPLGARLSKAKFNRWPEREMKIGVGELGGEAAVKGVPELLAAVTVPIVEPKPKPAPPVQLRPKIPPRGLAFGRGHRKASRLGASAAA